MRLDFSKFWKGFDPFDFFVPLLSLAHSGGENPRIDPSLRHLTISSVFPGSSIRERAADLIGRKLPHNQTHGTARIWYTGENQRPPLGRHDLYLGFDEDNTSIATCYLPIWWQNCLGVVPRSAIAQGREGKTNPSTSGLYFSVDTALTQRVRTVIPEKFCCAFIGNPTAARIEAIEALRRIGVVDVFGSFGGRPIASKMDVSGEYRFCLAFENDVYPGYVTEKLPDAWTMGAIPIYRGLDVHQYFDPRAYIDATSITASELVDRVAALDSGDAWLDMAEHRLLSRPPDLAAVISAIRQAWLGLS